MEKRFKKGLFNVLSRFIKLGVVAFLILNCLPLQTNAESTNGIVEESEYNPTYTIQHYLNYSKIVLDIPTVIDKDGKPLEGMDLVNSQASKKDTMIVWRTDAGRDNALPQNFEQQNSYGEKYIEKELYEQSPHSQVNLNNDGTVKTEKEYRKLFADETTSFFEKSQMRFMNKLYNNASDENHYNKNYTLEQVWLLKKDRDKDSTNEEDFYVLESPVMEDGIHHDPSKFTFTNYKDNPAFDDSTKVTNDNGVKYIGNKTDGYTILINKDTVIRLVFEPTTEENYNYDSVNFFDYDITDGWIYTTLQAAQNAQNDIEVTDLSKKVDTAIKDGTFQSLITGNEINVSGKLPTSYQSKPGFEDITFYTNTVKQGINNPNNISGDQIFAFGNNNAGTTLGSNIWEDSQGVTASLNKTNEGNRSGTFKSWDGKTDISYYGPSLRGATFGLAKGVNTNGSIKWSEGVNAPAIFSTAKEDAGIKGKTSYLQYSAYGTEKTNENYSLQFDRLGGTYTLSGVKKNVNTTNDGTTNDVTTIKDLNKLRKNNSKIYSNEFWPMDMASSYGTDGHDLKFGQTSKFNQRRHTSGTLPTSDDVDNDHNSYFGMTTYFDFVLQPGYCGPLNYFFYGDDDLLVFLSETTVDENGKVTVGKTKQVADIGGVHSSLGMYVDLWKFIDGAQDIKNGNETIATGIPYSTKNNPTETKTYRLSVYYTERGASGSSCYMRFTVPFEELAIDPITYDQNLQVEKKIKSNAKDKGVYAFQLDLTTPNGTMVNHYPYKRYDASGNEITTSNASIISGTKFFLKDGEKVVISHLPKDTDKDVETGYGYTVKELGRVDPSSKGYPDELDPNDVTIIPLTSKDSTSFMTGTIKDGLGQSLKLGDNYSDTFDQDNYIRFINAEDPGMLELEKQLDNEAQPTNDDFNFNVELKDVDGTPLKTLSYFKSANNDNQGNQNWIEQEDIQLKDGKGVLPIKAGEKVLIYNLPEGATYSITEVKKTNYAVKDIEVTGNGETTKDVSSRKISGIISIDKNEIAMDEKQPSNTIKYINTKSGTGHLDVSKLVEGKAGDTSKDFNFTTTLSDKTINGTYGDMNFTNGVATFTLKHGENKVATHLPAGIDYEVVEAEENKDGYVTTKKGHTGEIVRDETIKAVFTNKKDNITVTDNTVKPNKKTGDNTNIELYYWLFAISIVLLGIMIAFRKKIS